MVLCILTLGLWEHLSLWLQVHQHPADSFLQVIETSGNEESWPSVGDALLGKMAPIKFSNSF